MEFLLYLQLVLLEVVIALKNKEKIRMSTDNQLIPINKWVVLVNGKFRKFAHLFEIDKF